MSNQNGTFQSSAAHTRWRYLKDRIARYSVAIGGLGVIAAVMLIFVYLFYTVIPLFLPAEVEDRPAIETTATQTETLFLATEEQAEIGVRLLRNGEIQFFGLKNGKDIAKQQLSLNQGEELVQVSILDKPKGIFAAISNQARLFVLQHFYKISYPDDVRLITPVIKYPYGEEAISLIEPPSLEPVENAEPSASIAESNLQPSGSVASQGLGMAQAITPKVMPTYEIKSLTVADGENRFVTALGFADGRTELFVFNKASGLFSDGATLEPQPAKVLDTSVKPDFLSIDQRLDWLYVASKTGDLAVFGMSGPDAPWLSQTLRLTDSGQKLTAMSLLAGGISLITGSDNGEIEQWFMVRNDQNKDELTLIRDFDPLGNQAIEHIVPEYGRRGFIVSDTAGNIGVYYSTSGRQVLETQVRDGAISELAVSPRSDLLIVNTDNGKVHGFNLHNEHPEISWSSLWGKVWYESYTEPQFVWQSSSASNDFEPKFSLVPLSFGTLKAAFYAMLFAMPLAIMGAIYTAYFMAPDLRRMVKPTVEVMEALPTVILGFLAGLWLAPVVENNLPGIFSMLLLLPFGVIVFAYGWSRTPYSVRRWVPEGWQPALLVPAIVVFATIALLLSKPLELWLFGGNMPLWLDQELGISYDQRNALVVGLAMGFAVIPTIFSIAEDAIFSVPKQLSNGSLALGATPWQTLVRVVLPTASPGIFSSVMIGMGRAVGETMIVLMATGNTPVMDGSPFQGMRTLSANIAVEMPESEVGSTHFRILFLAGLVLFMFTFIFNTVAELVRQRLREKYSNL